MEYFRGIYKLKNSNKIKRELIEDCRLIFTTVNSAGRSIMPSLSDEIDYLIIDEATQCTEVSSLIPLNLHPH